MNDLNRIPVSERSTRHIWQPWAHGPASLHCQDIGGAACSLPASQWCCSLLADPFVCRRSGRVCAGSGVKSQEPTGRRKRELMSHWLDHFYFVFSSLALCGSHRKFSASEFASSCTMTTPLADVDSAVKSSFCFHTSSWLNWSTDI